MKNILIISFLSLFCLSCDNSDDTQNNNPNLFDPLVSLNLNLNLPEYNPLKFPGNSVVINQQGIRGIIIYNINNSLYTASDLTDPNHVPNDCSRMNVEGILANCPCSNDSHEYDIVTGKHRFDESLFPMQQYRAERTGDNLRVFN